MDINKHGAIAGIARRRGPHGGSRTERRRR
jgi:hypothetical protein